MEAAIACAVHDEPSRDPEPVRTLAVDAAARLKRRLERESPEEALAETMAGDLHFNGDLMTYDNLVNADIIAVCVRRRGLPVALGPDLSRGRPPLRGEGPGGRLPRPLPAAG